MTFHTCCGKDICNGCVDTMEESGAEDLCPFCKSPPSNSDEEEIERLKKRVEKGNADAFYQLGGYYARGIRGLPQDQGKANELWRLDVLWHISTWVLPMQMGEEWKLIRRKPSIIMSWQL